MIDHSTDTNFCKVCNDGYFLSPSVSTTTYVDTDFKCISKNDSDFKEGGSDPNYDKVSDYYSPNHFLGYI